MLGGQAGKKKRVEGSAPEIHLKWPGNRVQAFCGGGENLQGKTIKKRGGGRARTKKKGVQKGVDLGGLRTDNQMQTSDDQKMGAL